MRDLAQTFKALADETRLAMLALILARGELCVCDLTEVLSITQSKASRHLRYLKNTGLLDDRRDGLWVHYRVAKGLTREQRAIVTAARRTFDRPRLGGLERKLDAWLKRKSREGCKP
ncbi:MAG: metalloregulator ArsR/SmtB family transcription factor [Deltaproteobacteria bacterium]|nr:metalloregulator ArsR/SmtB family transcription factor [Deltaproteobacteria bacterium]